jgi:ribosome-associated protein
MNRNANHNRKNLAPKIKQAPASTELTISIVEASLEAKGKDISVLDVSDVFGLTDHFIIVTGRSDRQVQGICNKILESMEKRGIKPMSVEGFDQGHWVLIDFEDVIVHVFYEPVRAHYDLENLWLKAKKLDLVQKRGSIRLAAA